MAQFGVDLAKLRTALESLQTERKNLTTKVTELQTSEKTLSGKWEGDAKTSFESAFNSDVKYMNSFVTLVQQYESALQQVIAAYEAAEAANVSTATTRTYSK